MDIDVVKSLLKPIENRVQNHASVGVDPEIDAWGYVKCQEHGYKNAKGKIRRDQ